MHTPNTRSMGTPIHACARTHTHNTHLVVRATDFEIPIFAESWLNNLTITIRSNLTITIRSNRINSSEH